MKYAIVKKANWGGFLVLADRSKVPYSQYWEAKDPNNIFAFTAKQAKKRMCRLLEDYSRIEGLRNKAVEIVPLNIAEGYLLEQTSTSFLFNDKLRTLKNLLIKGELK